MSQSSTPAVSDAIYDASSLGRPRMFLLGLQHLFAMFGATVLVPVLTGLSVSATLLFAGLGTLLFHFLSRGKVPAFLGCIVCLYCRLCRNRAQRRDRAFALRLPGRSLRRSALSGAGGPVPRLWRQARHALLSAGGDGPHRHFHRLDSGETPPLPTARPIGLWLLLPLPLS